MRDMALKVWLAGGMMVIGALTGFQQATEKFCANPPTYNLATKLFAAAVWPAIIVLAQVTDKDEYECKIKDKLLDEQRNRP